MFNHPRCRQQRVLWPIWRASTRMKRRWWPRPWWSWGTSWRLWKRMPPPSHPSGPCLPRGEKWNLKLLGWKSENYNFWRCNEHATPRHLPLSFFTLLSLCVKMWRVCYPAGWDAEATGGSRGWEKDIELPPPHGHPAKTGLDPTAGGSGVWPRADPPWPQR